jgi:hypothetical protein
MRHDLEQAAGWVLAHLIGEAVRYPWPAAVIGLLGVIYVIRRMPARRAVESGAVAVVGTSGAPIAAAVITAALAGVIGVAWFMHQKPAAAAAAPKPVITQKIVRPVVIQHITHVAASSHTGLYVLIGVVAFLLVGLVLKLTGRAG